MTRIVTDQHRQGLLQAMLGYLNGMIHEVPHRNAVTDKHDRDDHGMRRPARIYNTIIFEHLAGGIPDGQEAITQNGRGPCEYDGAGNITRGGSGENQYRRHYHYDLVSRIRVEKIQEIAARVVLNCDSY